MKGAKAQLITRIGHGCLIPRDNESLTDLLASAIEWHRSNLGQPLPVKAIGSTTAAHGDWPAIAYGIAPLPIPCFLVHAIGHTYWCSVHHTTHNTET